jgi:preprotein translocase subunit YajC
MAETENKHFVTVMFGRVCFSPIPRKKKKKKAKKEKKKKRKTEKKSPVVMVGGIISIVESNSNV